MTWGSLGTRVLTHPHMNLDNALTCFSWDFGAKFGEPIFKKSWEKLASRQMSVGLNGAAGICPPKITGSNVPAQFSEG